MAITVPLGWLDLYTVAQLRFKLDETRVEDPSFRELT
jgi:hypothetical protein